MKATELNSKLMLNQESQKDFLKKKILVSNTRARKNYETGEIRALYFEGVIIEGPIVGEQLKMEIPIDKSPNELKQGDQVVINNITGIKVKGSSNEESTYVNYEITLMGTIEVIKVKE
ncbi:hypothetical protein [Limosilactobacillus reuteri]|uniref:hypothetical protein n=1 Tax=Limosilactobacillus reuteri TaxID=1598 RepID=UPI00128C8C49|nr:hypothetical protein [Limosilactobacillus reuteri]MBM6812975.1 hypothetical protein [Limosilactobacillus reuteri]MQB69401.1 hypothetical protein [Limosilactobacillus reuteri]MQC01506.1 hypothetical protein [Limosilactobacillus reuteri]MQC04748.1 hypothetical protein [Limosilactobacillus reuteri]